MKRVVSGITATGKITIGNYIGAIKNFIALQNSHELFIFVADLHALTIDIDPDELRTNKKSIMALYLALGLDPRKTVLFFQSDVKAHGYVSWILENQTTLGELSRMTQFKDKSVTKEANGTEKIKTGILTYPALMAGDILLYKPHLVPVGIDQKQHIELTRNIAIRMNNRFKTKLVVPDIYTPEIGTKILSLTDPTKKMSKSDTNAKSAIYLLDDPEAAYQKIQKAVTDSEGKIYVSLSKPGVTNLLTIYASLKNISLEKAASHFKDANYGALKHETGMAVKEFLTNLQNAYAAALLQVDKVAASGAQKASIIANETLKEIEVAIGLK